MHFIISVLSCAWKVSPYRNLIVLFCIGLSSVCSVLAPYYFGDGVGGILQVSGEDSFIQRILIVSIVYSLLWFGGVASKYLAFPMYGLIEQNLQAKAMAQSLSDSISAPPAIRSKLDNSEISFAIDSEAGAYRDVLSSLYLSILPAAIALIAGATAVIRASSWREGIIFLAAVVAYALASKKLIATHQASQSLFFKENLRSFGVIDNSLTLWREAAVFNASGYIRQRFLSDRQPVIKTGIESYVLTRRGQVLGSGVSGFESW
ncbi:ABC transporter transmembrane domain-containing protein [Corynebacterium sp.]|uniref:ABC transporter transmembrane domain-containing protein n=1 Tax=Corynebacterium sp. TaxID=1720 RepID=UPI0026DAE752|nr:ABC transporter transmembrane domain-containing protein [Corynebacterium sp.]MDO5032914.1 ABC transporter transmembrane domain-containing protein [Corynebacterium sp.]